MKTDDRDEHLGAALEDAVADLRPRSPDPGMLMRQGTSRRLAVLAAALLTVAVFIGVIGLAATQVGKDADGSIAGSRASRTFASPDYPWTMPVPDGWRAFATRSVGGPQEMVQGLRTSLVTDSSADLRGVQWFASELPLDVADSDVIVFVDPFVGTGAAEPTTLVLGAERDDDANAGWTWRDGKLCGTTGCARVYLWHGPEASRAALDTGVQVARGVRLVESRPDPTVVTPAITYQDLGRNAFGVEYPAGWTIADESLTPDLFDPREILSIATFPLRPGGTASTEAFLPGNAIADIGADDVFLTLQERVRSSGGSHFPTRPPGFGPGTGCPSGDAACVDGSSMALEGLRAWWIPFADRPSGRDFYAFVAMGEEAYRDPARSAAAWRVLDSLAFDPEEQLAELPPAIRDDYRSEFVSDERGYRFWPRSGPAERGVVYRFEVPHCGLDWLVDFDGAFWEGTAIVDGTGWVPADDIPDGDVGTIELTGADWARYEASDGTWTLLSRVDGPIVRQLCD
jgi:hypothetical protein